MGLRELLFGPPPVEERAIGPSFSVSDPALAEWLGISSTAYSGVEVTEATAFGVPAFYRAVSLLASTIAGLPLKTYSQAEGGIRTEVPSFLDTPAYPYPLSPFAWTELVMAHMLTRGETFLLHTFNEGGALVGTWPVHPAMVAVKWAGGGDKLFKVQLANGQVREYSTMEMTQVMSLSMDGLRGMSPLSLFRNSIGTAIAGEIAAAKSFTAPLIAGMVTPDEDMDPSEAQTIKEGLVSKIGGVANAGDIAVINRSLKYSPWMMTNEDAQFLESREFQVVEFARMFGLPAHLLNAMEKESSWGTGIAEMNLGLARYTLAGWTSRLEQGLTPLLPDSQFCEFEYAGLLAGTPEQEIRLLIEQVTAGLLTKDEARAIRNLPPLPKETTQPTLVKEDSNANAA